MTVTLEPGDRVLVTGASGFIGSAVVRILVGRGIHAVVLVEPGADDRNLDDVDVERVSGGLRDRRAVRRAVDGCRAVFHVGRAVPVLGARTPAVL